MGCKKILPEAAGENIPTKSEGLPHAVSNASKNSKDDNGKIDSTKRVYETSESKIANLEEEFKKNVSLHDNYEQHDLIESFSILALNAHADNSCKVDCDEEFQERGPYRCKSNERYIPYECGFQDIINHKILHLSGGSSSVERPKDAVSNKSSLGLSVDCLGALSFPEHCDPLSPESGYDSSPCSENSFSHNELKDPSTNLEAESESDIEEIFRQLVFQRPSIPTEELDICLNEANDYIDSDFSKPLEPSRNWHEFSKPSLTEENANELQPLECTRSHDLLKPSISQKNLNGHEFYQPILLECTSSHDLQKPSVLEKNLNGHEFYQPILSECTSSHDLQKPLMSEKNLNGHEFCQPILLQCTNSLDIQKPLTLEKNFKSVESYQPLSNKLKRIGIVPVQLKPIQHANRYRPILPKPVPSNEIFNESSLLKGDSNKQAKSALLEKLNQDLKEQYAKQIYNYLYENNKESAIFIENEENRRTNLHIAVINKEVENAFCIVAIHQQMQHMGKESQDAINLTDIEHKTALDYALKNNLIQLAFYLIDAGARCSSDAVKVVDTTINKSTNLAYNFLQ